MPCVWLVVCTFILLCKSSFQINAYDSSLQFNPQGRVLQVEYSKRRVDKGGAVIGVKCSDGLILIAVPMREKSKLSVKRQQKLFLLDDHICVAVTGMLFDAQAVISVARKICVQYRNSFQAPIPVERLSSELAGVMNAQTRKVNARPLGVCLLVAGADEHLGHQVYRVDPEGNLDAWKAVCIGRGSADVMSLLSSEVLSFDDTPVDVAWAHVKGVLMRNQKKLVVDTDVNSSAEVDVCVCHRDSGSGMLSWEYYTCNLVRTS